MRASGPASRPSRRGPSRRPSSGPARPARRIWRPSGRPGIADSRRRPGRTIARGPSSAAGHGPTSGTRRASRDVRGPGRFPLLLLPGGEGAHRLLVIFELLLLLMLEELHLALLHPQLLLGHHPLEVRLELGLHRVLRLGRPPGAVRRASLGRIPGVVAPAGASWRPGAGPSPRGRRGGRPPSRDSPSWSCASSRTPSDREQGVNRGKSGLRGRLASTRPSPRRKSGGIAVFAGAACRSGCGLHPDIPRPRFRTAGISIFPGERPAPASNPFGAGPRLDYPGSPSVPVRRRRRFPGEKIWKTDVRNRPLGG